MCRLNIINRVTFLHCFSGYPEQERRSDWFHSGSELCEVVASGEVQMNVGDRLEVAGLAKKGNPPGTYQHWAVVYKTEPEPQIMHFTSPEGRGASRGSAIASASASGSRAKGGKGNARVKVEKLGNYKRKIRINNEKDESHKPNSSEQMEQNMSEMLDNPQLVGQYNVRKNNCEHFANHIRYNLKESDQVKNNSKLLKVFLCCCCRR